jgi:cytochrome P450
VHRHLLSRSFTPRAIKQIEDRVRGFVRRILDEQVGSEGFDYVDDFGARIPAQVIASMLGTPDSDVDTIRHLLDSMLHTEEGNDLDREGFNAGSNAIGEYFMEQVRARRKHPTDDIMSALVTMEFEDDNGVTRKLSDIEACRYIHLLSGAGNETVARFAGWAAATLAKFPAERAKLVERPELIPNAVEELLRYEPPVKASARVSLRDVEWYGEVVPAGSAMVVVTASTGRDEREFPNPDVYDVERRIERHLGFGFGIHVCLGASLARLESRIMIEETLARFPEWDVDWSGVEMVHLGSAIRGYKYLPISFS